MTSAQDNIYSTLIKLYGLPHQSFTDNEGLLHVKFIDEMSLRFYVIGTNGFTQLYKSNTATSVHHPFRNEKTTSNDSKGLYANIRHFRANREKVVGNGQKKPSGKKGVISAFRAFIRSARNGTVKVSLMGQKVP